MDKEAKALEKAQSELDKVVKANTARKNAEKNAAEQAKLKAAEAEANKKLLEKKFRKSDLQKLIASADASITAADKKLYQLELDTIIQEETDIAT